MSDRHVVGLEVVVHRDLPVAVPVLDVQRSRAAPCCSKRCGANSSPTSATDLLQRRRIPGQAHEHEAEQDLHAHRLQAQLRAVERREGLAGRHAEQLAVQTVGPAVVRAGDGARAVARRRRACARRDGGTRCGTPGSRPGNRARPRRCRAPSVQGHVVARLRERADVADDLPARPQDALVFEAGHFRMVVDPGRQGTDSGSAAGLRPGGRLAIHGGRPAGGYMVI